MNKLLKIIFCGVAVVLLLMAYTACQGKKADTSASAQENIAETNYDDLNPRALAMRAYDLIIQLEGRDFKDPVVTEKLGLITEIVSKLSEADQRLYNEELERLYIGPEVSGSDFVIFGLWEETGDSGFEIEIKNDNSVSYFSQARLDSWEGKLNKTDTYNYQFHVTEHYIFRLGMEELNEIWHFTYNPETKQLRYYDGTKEYFFTRHND